MLLIKFFRPFEDTFSLCGCGETADIIIFELKTGNKGTRRYKHLYNRCIACCQYEELILEDI